MVVNTEELLSSKIDNPLFIIPSSNDLDVFEIFCRTMSWRLSDSASSISSYLILSRVSIACRPASALKSGILSPGLLIAAIRKAQARPKTTISRREFAPVQ